MITQKRFFLKKVLKSYKKFIKGYLLDVGGPSNFDKDYYNLSSCISLNLNDLEVKTNVIADVEEMPFADNTFDTILFIEALPCLKVTNFEKSLSECMRVLKPGGFIFVSTLFTHIIAEEDFDIHRHTKTSAKQLFEKYKIFEIRELGYLGSFLHSYLWEITNKSKLILWCRPFFSLIDKLTVNKRFCSGHLFVLKK